MGPICLDRNHSQIYLHMTAKFGHDRCRIANAGLEIRQILRTALICFSTSSRLMTKLSLIFGVNKCHNFVNNLHYVIRGHTHIPF